VYRGSEAHTDEFASQPLPSTVSNWWRL